MPSIQYSESPNESTAFVVQDGGQKNRAVLTAPQDTSTLELPDNPNSTKGYVTVNGKKHKVILTADISGGGGGGGGGGDSHNKGYYATPEALREAYPTAASGDFAIVGSTDTVWLWDSDTNAWKDSDQKGQVTSVNNQTGAVVITLADLGGQETLVSGTNIKTIDGNSVLGSGNLELSTYLPYPAGWTTNSTTKAFCDDIAADTTATVGKAYLGEVTFSDLPASMVNGEVVVEIMDGTTAANKVIVLSLKSGNVAPYAWQYVYWNNGTNISGWQGMGGAVSSVNSQTGAVVLDAQDVNAVPQYSTMPTASADELGNIYQYTGATDANYTNGYFYKCVSDGQNPATYSWTQTNVQPTPSGLPSQTGNAGKFLTTDGTDASWASVSGGIDWNGATEIAYDASQSSKTSVGFDFQNLPTGDYYFYIKTMQTTFINTAQKPAWQTAKISFHWDSTWTSNNNVSDFGSSVRVAPVLDGGYMGCSNINSDLINGQESPANAYNFSGSDNRFFLSLRSKFNSLAPSSGAAQNGDIIQVVSKLFGGTTPISMDNIAQAMGAWEGPQSYITSVPAGNSQPLVVKYSAPSHFVYSNSPVSTWATNGAVRLCESLNNIGSATISGAASINFSASFSSGEFDGRIIYATNGATTSQITKATGVFETARFYIQDGTCYLAYDRTQFTALQAQSEAVLVGVWISGAQADKWAYATLSNPTLSQNNLIPIATGMSSYVTDTPVYANLGGIIQYIGETNANYTKGFFYKANGTTVLVPESATMTPRTLQDVSVTVDIINLIPAIMALTGWSRASVIDKLSQYEWNITYNFTTNVVATVFWPAYGPMTSSSVLSCFTVSTTGTYSGPMSIACNMTYTPPHNELQNGSWDRIDVMSIETALQSITGYDATKTQTLQNVNGTFTWIDNI